MYQCNQMHVCIPPHFNLPFIKPYRSDLILINTGLYTSRDEYVTEISRQSELGQAWTPAPLLAKITKICHPSPVLPWDTVMYTMRGLRCLQDTKQTGKWICSAKYVTIRSSILRQLIWQTNICGLSKQRGITVTGNLSSAHLHVYSFCLMLVFMQLQIKIKLLQYYWYYAIYSYNPEASA